MCSSFDLTCPVVREQARQTVTDPKCTPPDSMWTFNNHACDNKEAANSQGSEVRVPRRFARRCAARFANCLSGRSWNCRTDRRTCIHACGDSLANGEHLAERHSVEGFVQVPVSTETQGR